MVGREGVDMKSQFSRAELERLLGATQSCREYGFRVAEEFENGMNFGTVVGCNQGGAHHDVFRLLVCMRKLYFIF